VSSEPIVATTTGMLRSPHALAEVRASAPFARRFLRHRAGVAGAVILLLLILLALFAPLIAPYSWAEQNIAIRWQGASRAHLFGTDEPGRDIFSRVLYGGRYLPSIGSGAVRNVTASQTAVVIPTVIIITQAKSTGLSVS